MPAVPFLVGGSHAFLEYTGIVRNTKDFDLFLRRADLDRAMEALRDAGYRTELHLPALAREGLAARRLRRSRLQLGQRHLHRRRRLVRPRGRDAGARHAREDRALRGAALAEGVRHGARALRRRRHHAHPAQRAPSRLDWAPADRRASASAGHCSTRTCCSSRSSIPSEAHRLPAAVLDDLAARFAAQRSAPSDGACLPGHAREPRAVPHRHRPVRLRRRAPRPARQHVSRKMRSTGPGRSTT